MNASRELPRRGAASRPVLHLGEASAAANELARDHGGD